MQICIFESDICENLEPLVYYRPVYDLVCGISTLKEKILRAYPNTKYSFHCRNYFKDVLKYQVQDFEVNEISDDDCLFINGSILAPENMSEIISPKETENKIYLNGDKIVAARVSGKKLEHVKKILHNTISKKTFHGLPVEQVDILCVSYVWDLINNTSSEIIKDYEYLTKNKKEKIAGKVHDGAYLINKEDIFIAEGAEIKPGSVLDATGGPIFIDKNALVFPNAVVEGPIYLGESAHIKSCARIYESVTIGKVSKVGGEVEHSIIMPFTNKQHSGFLGHAYIGSWVNIGADTNSSDLKNNYGSVKVYVNGEVVDSGCQFLGLMMGDHSKTAINTMFNTGTVVGFACNIFGPGFPDKYLPSFSWGGSEALTTYDLERSIETAKRMLKRRDKELHSSEEKLFRKIFELTENERRKRGYPY
jgi:UDP-N-acetylglucosamine diphosphorylase/glucosamine-1-phosphate N-acetyltransferase